MHDTTGLEQTSVPRINVLHDKCCGRSCLLPLLPQKSMPVLFER